MPSTSLLPLRRHVRISLAALTLVSVLGGFVLPASGQGPQEQLLKAGPETCVAMFTVMAYAYADDDLKEQQLEDKKALAKAAIPPQQAVVSADAPLFDAQPSDIPAADTKSTEDRIRNIMDILTEMMLNQPAQAEVIARECFRQYPPEIELN